MSVLQTIGLTLTSLLLCAQLACKGGSDRPAELPAPANEVSSAPDGPAPQRPIPAPAPAPLAATAQNPDLGTVPIRECPEAMDADRMLDEAGRAYDVGDFELAFACADAAAGLIPQAIEAQHTRAASLAALGLHHRAQVGFAMALALDPNDPETLAAAADFYINLLPPKHRDHTLVGLEYARRGSERAATRRHLDPTLRARLFLLEAEAFNDIGRADLALPRVEEALVLEPERIEARHEHGVSLFNLCRFREAEPAFLAVVRASPANAFAHQHLALIYERMGRDLDADKHFRRARNLAPAEFGRPVEISNEEFAAEVQRAIASVPVDLRKLLDEVSLEIVDIPALEDLTGVSPPLAPTILGLFRGLPLGVDEPGQPGSSGPPAVDTVVGQTAYADIPPRAIVLYRKNLSRAVNTREELDRQIRSTLVHEIGHLQGLDEEQLRRRGLE